MRGELIGHVKSCMTDIYLHIDARVADYIRPSLPERSARIAAAAAARRTKARAGADEKTKDSLHPLRAETTKGQEAEGDHGSDGDGSSAPQENQLDRLVRLTYGDQQVKKQNKNTQNSRNTRQRARAETLGLCLSRMV